MLLGSAHMQEKSSMTMRWTRWNGEVPVWQADSKLFRRAGCGLGQMVSMACWCWSILARWTYGLGGQRRAACATRMVGDAFRHVQGRLSRAVWDVRLCKGGGVHLSWLWELWFISAWCECGFVGYVDVSGELEWRGPLARAVHQASSCVMGYVVRHNKPMLSWFRGLVKYGRLQVWKQASVLGTVGTSLLGVHVRHAELPDWSGLDIRCGARCRQALN